ncbi:hypothetical protein FM076_05845 [Streptomyces albus subsp. chlorinus]|uniref:hypothetical protein n=1 Tax=Streptomyces albus TaxID=1888 RepID=UPI00156E94DB|nr:hypothetical protein [Streptomyces albus]NSC20748.1 hypothetical protein [Streptomyces albus subsp. chlorinus]
MGPRRASPCATTSWGRSATSGFELHGRVGNTEDSARVETHAAAIHLLNEGGLGDPANALLKVNENRNTQISALKNGFGLISNHLDLTREAHARDERDIVLGMESASRIAEYFHNDSDPARG